VFMMMHPDAIKTMKKLREQFMSRGNAKPEKIASWVDAKI